MVARGLSKSLAVVSAAVLLAVAGLALNPARAGQSAPPEQSSHDILESGLDALADHQPGLARQLFERLLSDYPDSPEAPRANRELGLIVQSATAAPDTTTTNRTSATGTDAAVSPSTAALRLAFVTNIGDRVFFAENSSTIGGRARALLENQARWLKARPGVMVKVVGRADDGGPPQSAKDLSSRRAEAVRDQLVAAGLPAARIAVEGRGDRDPLATCRTFMCQAQNRLAETLILEPEAGFANGTGDDAASPDLASRDAAATGVSARAAAAR